MVQKVEIDVMTCLGPHPDNCREFVLMARGLFILMMSLPFSVLSNTELFRQYNLSAIPPVLDGRILTDTDRIHSMLFSLSPSSQPYSSIPPYHP